MTFSAAVDPTSVNDYVNTAYKLFPTNADGSLGTPIVMSCTPYTTTATTCTTTSTLAANTKYVASATFLQTPTAGNSGPAHVAPTITGLPTDAPNATNTNGSAFFGSRTVTFRTPCP